MIERGSPWTWAGEGARSQPELHAPIRVKAVTSELHRRRSIRLQGYDYSQAGAYFVTICAQDRECLFGEIQNGQVTLNSAE